MRNVRKGLGHEGGRFTLCLGAQSEPAENSSTQFALTLSRRLRSTVLRTSLRVLARLGAVVKMTMRYYNMNKKTIDKARDILNRRAVVNS